MRSGDARGDALGFLPPDLSIAPCGLPEASATATSALADEKFFAS